jgi:hypothetical protein
MLIKISGVPIDEVTQRGIDVKLNVVDAWELLHVPVNVDMGIVNVDMNPVNVPIHAFHLIKPHLHTVFEHIF